LRLYADVSFLASLYLPDQNADAARAMFERIEDGAGILFITELSILETRNAIGLGAFRNLLTPDELAQTIVNFIQDISAQVFQKIALPPDAWKAVNELSRLHTPSIGCRSLDILQVAIGLLLNADQFLTFDQRQRELALAAGLDAPDFPASYS
jgi:hypothetical protein